MKVFHVFSVAVAALSLSSCAEQRIDQNQSDLGPNLYNAQYSQINYQLSRAIDDAYSVPSFAFVTTGALTSTDSATVAGTYTSAAAGLTRSVTGTLGGASNSFVYTSNTVGDPDALRTVRDIYAYTVGKIGWQAEFSKLKMPPPKENWLVKDGSAKPGLTLIGKFGNHVLWTNSQKAYSDFVFSILSALAPVEESPAASKGKAKGDKSPKTAGSRSFTNPKGIMTFQVIGGPLQ